MQASFYIIERKSRCIFMNFLICGSSPWWLRARMVPMTALDIQVSVRSQIAILRGYRKINNMQLVNRFQYALFWNTDLQI